MYIREEERKFYESIHGRVDHTLEEYRKAGLNARNYTSVLVLLLRLRQACNHPSLISKGSLDDEEAVDP